MTFPINTDPPLITLDLPPTAEEVGAIQEKLTGLPFITGVTRSEGRLYVTFSQEPDPNIRGEIMRRLKAPR